jgi:FkbM family methyltransferase
MAIGRSILTTGIHDPAVTEILARLIDPGGVVVDAGAHVGYMTVLAALATAPDGHVFAWEPHPQLFAVLQQNVAAVPSARITLRNAALGGVHGHGRLVPSDEQDLNDGTSHLERDDAVSARSIPVIIETIDDVVGVTQIDVLKLDVEGAECLVLDGASQALSARRIRHIVFEEHGGPDGEVVRLLQSMGYAIFAIGWSMGGLKLGPLESGPLAPSYEAPSYVATLTPGAVRTRCAKRGWLTLSARFADRPSGRPPVDSRR